MERFADSRALRERVALPAAGEQDWVDERRSLENPIDTDFSFLDEGIGGDDRSGD